MKTTGIQSFYYNKIVEIPYLADHIFEIGEYVIFLDEEKQEEIGQIAFVGKENTKAENVSANSHILRKATPRDLQKHDTNKERNEEAFRSCLEKIEKHALNMQLVKVNYSFNGAKINFIFTADARVDFRELVRDLANCFKKQIHLQQIGPRDRAKQVVAFGKCGRQTCCTRYIAKFESITMDMVREQNMENRGSEKLSGLCGKLLCCLKYEVEEYQKLRSEMPAPGSRIRTKDGKEGRVLSVDALNQKVRVEIQGESSKILGKSEIQEVLEKHRQEVLMSKA